MYAAIDIGTNSVRLLLYSEETGKKQKFLTTTRIGEGLSATGRLSKAAMDRTRTAVWDYCEAAIRHGAKAPIPCYATSAVREAENGADFMAALNQKETLTAEVISGEAEAHYGYAGAVKGGSGLVMDIGGGSTELILGEKGNILKARSMVLGCVTSLESCIKNDPPLKEEIDALRAYAAERAVALKHSVLGEDDCTELIGIGGTATQLAMVLLGLREYDPQKVNGYRMKYEKLSELFSVMAAMPLAHRKEMPGMDPKRADVIVTGCAIALEMMAACGANTLIACDDDGLDGYLMAHIAENS
ncbi:MAG: Ppx/GppA family phosphatase [Clostridiales bacterium]|nr:Ppx/GppA family phosphatase [Clostridiales bacterium]